MRRTWRTFSRYEIFHAFSLRQEANRETARNLIKLAVLSDQQIAEATGLTVADVQRLRAAGGSV